MTNAPSEDRISFLDHIRGIAIVIVLAFHALDPAFGVNHLVWAGWWRDFGHVPKSFLPLLPISFGWAGVAIFFVVSGFCIHLSHERSRQKTWTVFFIRRVFRIYPPYFLALCLFAFFVPLSKLSGSFAENTRQFVSHLFLLQNYDKELAYGINGSFWSIATEFQLYLLYPLLMAIVGRWGWRGTLWLTACIEIPLRTADFLYDFQPPHYFRAIPIFYWFSWAIGAKIADDWLKGRPLFLRNVPGWIFPALTLVSFFWKPLFTYSFLFIALSTVQWIAAWIERPAAFVSRSGPLPELLRRIGIVSYSVYLLHQPILYLVPDGLRWALPHVYFHPVKIFLIAFFGVGGAVCLFSWAFYRVVELPSIDLGKRLALKCAKPAAPQPVAAP